MLSGREIVEALGGTWNQQRHQGMGQCPVHNDHKPSLDVTEKDGRVLFTCRAGCAQDAVLDALRARGLWQKVSNGALCHPDYGVPQITYEYYDKRGQLFGAVARWNFPRGKEVRPAIRDGDHWAWKGFPKPRTLYNLPDLLAHPEKPVLIVEGEKAADAAKELISNCVATTWQGGTGAVNMIDLAPLAGRDVILWPDNDDPGRKAMRVIADHLGDARSVKGVKLPEGLDKGWDLGDAIPASLDPVALVGRAVDVRSSRLSSLPIKSASTIDSTEYAPIRWAVPDLVPDGVSILAGPKSRGKSFIVLDLALAVAGGTAALGNIDCEPGAVLYLALEDSERRIRDRQRAILQGKPAPPALDIATEWNTLDKGGLEDIEAWIAARPAARLVIVDVLAKFKGQNERGRDRGVYDQDYDLMTPIHALARKRCVAIILVHHTNKGTAADPVLRISGTMGLSGAADTTLVLSREAREMHGTLDVRGRDVPEREIALQFDADTGCVTQLGPADDFRKSEQRREIIRLLFDNAMTPGEVAKELKKTSGSVRRMLSKLKRAGDIGQLPNGKYYATEL